MLQAAACEDAGMLERLSGAARCCACLLPAIALLHAVTARLECTRYSPAHFMSTFNDDALREREEGREGGSAWDL